MRKLPFFAVLTLAAASGCVAPPIEMEGETPVTQVTSGRAGEDKDPEVSPDGKLLYFVSSSFGETLDLYAKSIGANSATRLTAMAGDKRFPKVSPADPRWVAFCTNARGEWEIALLNTADVAGRVEFVSPPGRQSIHPSWSPDGRKLVYCSTEDL